MTRITTVTSTDEKTGTIWGITCRECKIGGMCIDTSEGYVDDCPDYVLIGGIEYCNAMGDE